MTTKHTPECACTMESFNNEWFIKHCPMHKAAPELLDELRLIVEGWSVREKRTRGTEPLNPWEQERLGFLRAALAKAEGK